MNENIKIWGRIREAIVTFFSSGLDLEKRSGFDTDRVFALQTLNVFSAVVIFFIIAINLSYKYFKLHSFTAGDEIFTVFFLLVFLSLIIYLRRTKNDSIGKNITIISLFALFVSGVLFYDKEGLVYIYISLIPFFMVYLKGSLKGIYWLAAFFIIYMIIYTLALTEVIATKFPVENLDHLFAGSLVLSICAVFFMRRIENNTRIIKSQLGEIEKISKIDYLTRIFNKKAFMEMLERERQRVLRRDGWMEKSPAAQGDGRIYSKDEYRQAVSQIKGRFSMFSIIIFDIDFFKIFNDSYGHMFGDYILKWIGELLLSKELLRDNDIAGRFGGEEFIVLLPDTNSEKAMLVAERLRERIVNMEFSYQNYHDISITLSLGIAEMPSADIDGEEIIKMAEIAVNFAKESGRNSTVIYREGIA